MPRIHQEDLDARDSVAEGVYTTIISSGNYVSFDTAAASAYNAAESFLAERSRRIAEDRRNAPPLGGHDEEDVGH